MVEHAARDLDAEEQQHEQREEPLQALDDLVHRAVVVVLALRGPHRHRAGEHREEAVALRHLGHAVRGQQRGQRQQRLALLGQPQRLLGRAERHAGEQPADQHTGHDADRDLADDVPGEPRADPAEHRAAGGHQHRGVDEGEGEAVVQPGLGREREPHLAGLAAHGRVLRVRQVLRGLVRDRRAGPADLHVGGEHRVRRCQHGTQDQGRRDRQPQGPPEQGDAEDAERHRDPEQPPGRRPGPPGRRPEQVERPVERETDAHECDQHGELGDVLDQRPVGDQVELQVVGERRPAEGDPDHQQHQRRRDGVRAQGSGQQDGQQEAAAGKEEEGVRGHCATP